MNVFFEEDGSFKVASIMSETDSALQVESISGKRSKIKANHVLLRFEAPLTGFLEAANQEAEPLDLDFLWECCGEEEFGFAEFAADYYGRKPSAVESAAIAIKPVSYTHLDVYKRQVKNVAASNTPSTKLCIPSPITIMVT